MIEFIKMTESDVKEMLEFLQQEDIDKKNFINQLDKIFLAKDQGKIYGFGLVELSEGAVKIKGVYIQEDKRRHRFGDGLVRTMLHYAYLKNMTKAFYQIQNNSLDSFIEKMGFRQWEPNILYLDLGFFFSKTCHNCK